MDNINSTSEDLKALYASLNKRDMELQVQIRALDDRMKVSTNQLQETMKQYGEFVSDEVKAMYDNIKAITKDFTVTVLSAEDMEQLMACLPLIQGIQGALTTEAGEIQKKLKHLTDMQGS